MAITVAQMEARVTANVSDAESKLGAVGRTVDSLGQTANRAGQVAAAGFVALGAGAAAGIGKAINIAADFESGMSGLQAASSASADEMQQLGAAAVALGADTQLAGIGASDAAAAMAELAKGGVSVTDQLGGATKGALLLASAGAISVSDAAGLATKAMNIFGLAGSDVAHVADLLAAGANKSATDVGQLGAAFNQSAAVAKNAGLNIETLTGTLAFMAQRGMEGSDAGTSLKTALLALQAPTDIAAKAMDDLGINVRDSVGHMLPMADIADVLKSRLSGLSDAQRDAALKTIFGNDAIRVGIALYEGGGDAIRDWTTKVDDAGVAARTGAIRNDNLKGSLSQLGAVFETAAIQLGGKFTPLVRTATDSLAGLVNQAASSKEVERALSSLADHGAKALQAIIAKVSDPAFQQQMRLWATTALDTGRAVVSLAGDVMSTLGPPLKVAADWFGSLDDQGRKNVVMFGLVAGAAVQFRDELGGLKNVVETVIDAFGRKLAAKKLLTDANGKLAGSAEGTTTAMSGTSAAAAAAGMAIADAAIIAAAAAGTAYVGTEAWRKYADATGLTIQQQHDFVATQDAASFAIKHGANEVNGAVAGFVRYLDASGTVIASNDQMAAAWNRYLGSVQAAGGATTAAGLDMALATKQAGGLTAGANALAGSLPLVVSGLNAGAVAASSTATAIGGLGSAMQVAANAAGAMANPVSGAALAVGALSAASVQATGHLAGTGLAMGAFATAVAGAQGTVDNYGKALQGLGTEQSHLQSLLSPLQAQWDALNVATDNGKHVTAAQKAEYERLAPAIQYLNAQIGVNKDKTVDAALAAVQQQQALDNTNAAAIKGAIQQVAYGNALSAAASFSQAHAKAADTSGASMAGAAIQAAILTAAIGAIPKSFTVTATVDISQAIQQINTLANNMPHSPAKEGPFRTLPNWGALFESWGPALRDAITAFESFGNDAAKKGAETASAVAQSITAALGALTAVGKLNVAALPNAAQLTGFSAATNAMVAALTESAAQFKEDALKAAASFADTASKVGGSISATLTGLAALARFDFANDSPTGSALGWFSLLAVSLVTNFALAGDQFEIGALEVASQFADASGKVGSSVGATLTALKALATTDWATNSPTGSAMAWFTHLAASLVQNFATAAALFEEGALTSASSFADSASKVGGSVGTVLTGLKALASADWAQTSPSGSAMGWFTHLAASLVQSFADAAATFKDGGLKAAGEFGDAVGKVAGAAGSGLAVLKALATEPVTVSKAALDAFISGIRYIVSRFGDAAALMSTEGIAKLGAFSTAAGQALGAAKTGVDLFKDFEKLVIPSKKAIDDLLIAVRYVVDQFGAMAASLAVEGIAKMQAFAAAAGQSLSAAKTGTDLFKDMEKLSVPSKQAIDNLLAGIVYVVLRFGEIADQIGTTGLKKAQDFAIGALAAFTPFKQGLELLGSLKDFKALPVDAINALIAGMKLAFERMGELQSQANAFEQQASTYLATMENAARMLAKGMAIGGGTPTLPSSSGSSNTGSGAFNAQDFLNGLPGIPMLASGGIVTRPTLAVLGEAGREAVIPLPASGGGMGSTVNVYIMAPVYGVDHMEDVVVGAIETATARGRL